MNSKFYVGRRITDFEQYNSIGPVTGAEVIVSDSEFYASGDTSGYTLTVQCRYGTQAMADNLVIAYYGKTYYGYRASGVSLPAEAELGDAIEVKGMRSVIAYQSLNFGPNHISEISAPGDSELTHEYQYTSTSEKLNNTDAALSYVQVAIGEMQKELNSVKARLNALDGKDNTDGTLGTVQQLTSDVTNLIARVSALEGA